MVRIAVVAIIAALLAGAGGFALGRLTHVGERHAAVDAEIDKLLEQAENALRQEHYDEPQGNNVLDLTDQVLSRRGDEPRARSLRQRAADRLVRRGLDRKALGYPAEALASYELAAKLARPDHGLLQEIEATKKDLASKNK